MLSVITAAKKNRSMYRRVNAEASGRETQINIMNVEVYGIVEGFLVKI